eukprot:NODE_2492_length_2202_cov_7.530120.p1 GENE.NODE_2492_length_2202_cov_7.530120~~NODE_2492_length_2202_cov_7.530120.p1  ORF type:complete len:360 (+),score=100.53 NODE_2492_length_2202_cov_7.530120:183-1262(+)
MQIMDRSCALTGVGIDTQSTIPMIRFQFANCVPQAAISVPLKPEADGLNLVPWMCRVMHFTDLCQRAQQAVSKENGLNFEESPIATSTAMPEQEIGMEGYGDGLCRGPGLHQQGIYAETIEECALACANLNLDDDASNDCTGFAYKLATGNCFIYSQAQVTNTNGHKGFSCYKPWTPNDEHVSPKVHEVHHDDIFLDIERLMSIGTLTRYQIYPVSSGCFEPADWLVADNALPIPRADWDMFMKLRELVAPRTVRKERLTGSMRLDRVCLEQCDGTLPAGCELPARGGVTVFERIRENWWWIWIVLLFFLLIGLLIGLFMFQFIKGRHKKPALLGMTFTRGRGEQGFLSVAGGGANLLS